MFLLHNIRFLQMTGALLFNFLMSPMHRRQCMPAAGTVCLNRSSAAAYASLLALLSARTYAYWHNSNPHRCVHLPDDSAASGLPHLLDSGLVPAAVCRLNQAVLPVHAVHDRQRLSGIVVPDVLLCFRL